MNFFIGIPTINRADLLNDALHKYEKDFPDIEIFVADNGHQNIYVGGNIRCFNMGKNLGVSASWNFLLSKGFGLGHERGVILNDDIYWGKTQGQIEHFIERHSDKGFMVCKKEWSAFILDKTTFDVTGGFDTRFYPAYFEDNDFGFRMRLLGVKRIHSEELDPIVYRNSMSIQKDPTLNHGFEKNRQYYIQKWGGNPSEEKFTKPFNK